MVKLVQWVPCLCFCPAVTTVQRLEQQSPILGREAFTYTGNATDILTVMSTLLFIEHVH